MSKRNNAYWRQVFGAKGVEGDLEWHGQGSGCFVVPESVIYSRDFLSAGEERLWLTLCLLCQRRNPNSRVCWPSRETLAVMLNASPRQVSTYIKGLVSKGVLHVHQRANGTSYYLLRNIPESRMNRTIERLPKLERVEVIQKRAKPKASLQPILAETKEASSEMISAQEPTE